jgi:ParB family chromosome partitioning protein
MEKLFTTEEDVEQVAGIHLLAIRMDAVQPDPKQPRRTFPEVSLVELSESIKQDGVIQPIEVTQVGKDEYKIVHGERRWRAAQMAGLETIPAMVRRLDYDSITRFVRQLVENIQREDLNDVDRAAGLLHLRDLMQEELDSQDAEENEKANNSPWAKTISWAKVGNRMGYSRQRIHQLIQLLELPEEIKQDVRDRKLSERETRVYQGLQTKQQLVLHRARRKKNLSPKEMRLVARLLKKDPSLSVSQAIEEIRERMPPAVSEPPFDSSFGRTEDDLALAEQKERSLGATVTQKWLEEIMLPPEQNTNRGRLVWIRILLARTERNGLSTRERMVMLHLLNLIQQDVNNLVAALRMNEDISG